MLFQDVTKPLSASPIPCGRVLRPAGPEVWTAVDAFFLASESLGTLRNLAKFVIGSEGKMLFLMNAPLPRIDTDDDLLSAMRDTNIHLDTLILKRREEPLKILKDEFGDDRIRLGFIHDVKGGFRNGWSRDWIGWHLLPEKSSETIYIGSRDDAFDRNVFGGAEILSRVVQGEFPLLGKNYVVVSDEVAQALTGKSSLREQVDSLNESLLPLARQAIVVPTPTDLSNGAWHADLSFGQIGDTILVPTLYPLLDETTLVDPPSDDMFELLSIIRRQSIAKIAPGIQAAFDETAERLAPAGRVMRLPNLWPVARSGALLMGDVMAGQMPGGASTRGVSWDFFSGVNISVRYDSKARLHAGVPWPVFNPHSEYSKCDLYHTDTFFQHQAEVENTIREAGADEVTFIPMSVGILGGVLCLTNEIPGDHPYFFDDLIDGIHTRIEIL